MIIRRGVLTDLYVEDDRSVVMVAESVLGLSPVATAILEAVPEGMTASLRAVTDHVVATLGPPNEGPSADDITRQHVWDLVAHGVLEVVDEGGSLREASQPLSDGQPGAVDAEDSALAVNALREALRHLRSNAPGRWPAPASISPSALVRAARLHHVVPYLAGHLDRLDLPYQARSQLEAVASRQHAGATILAADLAVAMEALEGAGVRALAFKGVSLAAQAYDNYLIRGAGDLDLLVSPEELTDAHLALWQAGWRPAAGYPVPDVSWGWRHFVRTGNELTLSGPGSDIDLHWDLAPTRGTFPDFETLWSRHAVVSVAGHPIPTLAAYDALAHSAGHAAKDGWRWLRSLVDVHTLMADPQTWLQADRPLRSDQLLTVGLAARQLGMPAEVPLIVSLAAGRVDDTTLERVLLQQQQTAPEHRSAATPGVEFLQRLQTIRLTSGTATEAARLFGRSALPPWLTAQEPSARAWEAVPKVLERRLREVLRKGLARRHATRA